MSILENIEQKLHEHMSSVFGQIFNFSKFRKDITLASVMVQFLPNLIFCCCTYCIYFDVFRFCTVLS